MLPVEPFRVWLTDVVRRHGSVEAAEGALGLTARTIRRFTSPKGTYEVGQREVSLDIVDWALCHEGNSFLWELYPAWWESSCDETPLKIVRLTSIQAGDLFHRWHKTGRGSLTRRHEKLRSAPLDAIVEARGASFQVIEHSTFEGATLCKVGTREGLLVPYVWVAGASSGKVHVALPAERVDPLQLTG